MTITFNHEDKLPLRKLTSKRNNNIRLPSEYTLGKVLCYLDMMHLLDYPGLVYIRNFVTLNGSIPDVSSYIDDNPYDNVFLGSDFHKGIFQIAKYVQWYIYVICILKILFLTCHMLCTQASGLYAMVFY